MAKISGNVAHIGYFSLLNSANRVTIKQNLIGKTITMCISIPSDHSYEHTSY